MIPVKKTKTMHEWYRTIRYDRPVTMLNQDAETLIDYLNTFVKGKFTVEIRDDKTQITWSGDEPK